MLRTEDNTLPDLANNDHIMMIPLGGSLLIDWVTKNHLKKLKIPEVHIYDRDLGEEYFEYAQMVNDRDDQSRAFITNKREIENYLHPNAIQNVFNVIQQNHNISVAFSDTDDVEAIVKEALGGQHRIGRRPLKDWLANEVVSAMTLPMLEERGGKDEISSWLKAIGEFL